MLTKLTHEGRKTIKKNPERILEVDNEFEKMGVKVLDQYALLGPYDFLNILEAPNNEVIAKASIEFSSRGTIEIMTLAAITTEELIGKMTAPTEFIIDRPRQLDG
jgi:uncharacterized protein with GYD domain